MPHSSARQKKRSDRLGVRLDRPAGPVGGPGVVAGLAQRAERRPDLEAQDLVRLARLATHDDDRRPVLLRERRPLHAGLSEDERPRRHVHPLAIELEGRAALEHEVQLLLVVLLGVLVDDPVAGLSACEAADAERSDAEVLPHRPIRRAAVVDLVDRVEAGDGVGGHRCRIRTGVPKLTCGILQYRPRR